MHKNLFVRTACYNFNLLPLLGIQELFLVPKKPPQLLLPVSDTREKQQFRGNKVQVTDQVCCAFLVICPAIAALPCAE